MDLFIEQNGKNYIEEVIMAKSIEINKNSYDTSYTQNRELSWLRFNERVLDEARDITVPLYERLKFVSIFNSNLDEFFMIRVGSLSDLDLTRPDIQENKTGQTPREQLANIFKEVRPLCRKADTILREIENQMRQFDVSHLPIAELSEEDRKFIFRYFKTEVQQLLSPQVMGISHPFPHLANKVLHIGVELKRIGEQKKYANEKNIFGIIPVPGFLPKLVILPGKGTRYILLEEIIFEFAGEVFPGHQLVDKAIISVTRNADITPDIETFDEEVDFRDIVKKALKRRARLAPVRIEFKGAEEGSSISEYFMGMIGISPEQTYYRKAPLSLNYIFQLEEKMQPKTRLMLMFKPFEPQYPASIDRQHNITRQTANKDLLLYYPFDSMEPFLQIIKEAAEDPNVISIKISIYRLANRSKLVEHLIAAAENGKDVTVLMELMARFDEANNINWAEVLEEAGCKIIYGIEGFKVHSKICLITHREKNKTQYITQIGTGNYNEKTVKMYTDLSLITADQSIGEDANAFFKNMSIGNLNGQYNELLVAPSNLKSRLMEMVEDEISKANQGMEARILLKVNSISDRSIIDKLAQASQAGVKIDLIVRGICCILPGIEGRTENIHIISIVGRFLEHPRIYAFGAGEDMNIYIGSADAMTRNINNRVEVLCPVKDKKSRDYIIHILDVMLRDNTKARLMQKDGRYMHIDENAGTLVNSQEVFIEEAIEKQRFYKTEKPGRKTIGSFLRSIFRKESLK